MNSSVRAGSWYFRAGLTVLGLSFLGGLGLGFLPSVLAIAFYTGIFCVVMSSGVIMWGMEEFYICIEGWPPSVNRVWRKLRGRMIKNPVYVHWENKVAAVCLSGGDAARLRGLVERPYKLVIEVVAKSWWYTTGSPKKPDVSNFVKAAEDAVCRVYGWDDAWCQELEIRKVEGPRDETRMWFHFGDKKQVRVLKPLRRARK